MKPRRRNAPRATPVAATSGANLGSSVRGGSGRCNLPARPAMLLAPAIAVPIGAPMPAVKGGSSRRVWPRCP
jgi:hypothetical protein